MSLADDVGVAANWFDDPDCHMYDPARAARLRDGLKLIAAAPEMLAMLLEIERLEDEASICGDRTPLGSEGSIRLTDLLDRYRGGL